MKKRKILLGASLLFVACLTACNLNFQNNDSSSQNNNQSSLSSFIEQSSSAEKKSSDSVTSSSDATSSISSYSSSSSIDKTSSSSSSNVPSSSSSNPASSSSASQLPSSSFSSLPSSSSSDHSSTHSSSSSSAPIENVTLDIFALNDTHGNVKDTQEKGLGIAKTTTLLKELSQGKNSIFISQGDMWQGSVESNYTRGNLVTEWMNSLNFVSMTVGNHEYDWGSEAIVQNSSIANFPTLGINVVYKSTGNRVEYLQPSTTFTRGGAKIGVIGAIGNCLSSISGSKVKGVKFLTGNALTQVVKDEATRLRNQEKCDFIIYSFHGSGSRDEADDYDISLSNEHYVDLVLEGHTHNGYAEIDDAGIYHVQCNAYNKSIYQITVDLNLKNKSFVVNAPVYYNLKSDTSPYKDYAEDSATNALFTKYHDSFAFAYEDVGVVSLRKNADELRNKIAELYYQEGVEKWGSSYNIEFGGGYLSCRGSYLEAGIVNYSDLANLFPFDNDVVLCASTGANLKKTQFITGSEWYFVDWAEGKYPSYPWEDNKLYYYVTDTYSSDFYTAEGYAQRLEVIDFLSIGRYARDMLADFIKAGGWEEQPLTHEGTISDPKTIAEALTYAEEHPGANVGVSGAEEFFYKGVVSAPASDINSTTNDLKNVYVKDAGTSNEILIYYLKKHQGATKETNWQSISDLKVGDTIIFCGRAFCYVGNNGNLHTLEFGSGTYVYSINGVQTA